MKCVAIVPARWHTPAHQCTFDARIAGLCTKHANMRCIHDFSTNYNAKVGNEHHVVSWCPKCGSVSVTSASGTTIHRPESYAVTGENLKVLNIP